ncbi:MAG: M28 family peptidase [Ignavibacteria bacterium]|nr:M28 family peptidase [Ignavibacteria bacterium]
MLNLLRPFIVNTTLLLAVVPLWSGSEHTLDTGNAEAITGRQLRDDLEFISSDDLRGRDTPSPGLDSAAVFIASRLSGWGLKPAGDTGTYFQYMGLRRDMVDAGACEVLIDEDRFVSDTDFIAKPVPGSARGRLVYAGNGYVVKEKGINPYTEIDIRDAVVVFSAGRPPTVSLRDLRKAEKGAAWDSPQSYCAKHGAVGLIEIPTLSQTTKWGKMSSDAVTKGTLVLEVLEDSTEAKLPQITASARLAAAIFGDESDTIQSTLGIGIADGTVVPFELSPQKSVSIVVNTRSEYSTTRNVIGILRGNDPDVRNEYVALGAHYDHVGVGPPVEGDSIYNGADDDGTGTVALLAIARALAHGKQPRRSVLFVWHTGEEKGLLGSKFFTRFPTVPLENIVVQLNIDMIGRSRPPRDSTSTSLSGPNEVYVIGSNAMSTELGAISTSINSSYLRLNFNYKYDDTADPLRLFFRSDHYNYAQKGIPIIFYFDGLHSDYHKPSDSVDKIDFDKLEKVTRTVHATVWHIANVSERPHVDLALPQEWSDK